MGRFRDAQAPPAPDVVRGRVAGRGGLAVTVRRARIAGKVLLAAALEIGLVPAAALQPETRRADLALQMRLAAFRADGQGFIRDLLQFFELVIAAMALVFVDRHTGNLLRLEIDYTRA
jgi:hypothetical protein